MEPEESSDYVNMKSIEDINPKELEINHVEDKVEDPKVGMTFDSSDEVASFYLEYGKKMGFAVCKRTCRKDENGEVRYVTVTCAREGKPRRTSKKLIKKRPAAKMNCRARVSATLCLDGKWTITSVELEHNHDLSPSKSRFYRCNRTIQSHVKRTLELNDRAGIQMNKSFNSFVVEAGGYENLTFQEKDCRNYIDKVRRLRLGEGDVIAVHNYFLKMQADNFDFFYMMDHDGEGRLKNIFWADARSRATFKEFGDVITFDTTYLTNKYDMPFAPFVGVNHHGQSVLLGCGLISNENVDTFTWLFRSWLTCMFGDPPSAIITDQDKAMKKAIEIVFPNSRHRWCLWHIMKKLPEKLRAYEDYESIKICLQTAVYDSLTIAEFEENWCRLIIEYKLDGNEWLSGLYEERNRWVPAFVKDTFWAGMSTTQRSESMNSFFDGYVTSKTSLKLFVEQYEHALKNKVEKENIADFKSFNSCLPCISPYEMEKQYQKEYTTSKFKEFQQELVAKMFCELSSCVEGVGNAAEYEVSEDVSIGEKIRRARFKVCYNEGVEEVNCNCRLFQFKGILCRHAITMLIHRKVYRIPEKYILKRWSKTVKRSHTKVKISYDDWSANPEARRFNKMCNAFREAADLATYSDDISDQVITWIHELKNKLTTNLCGIYQDISKKRNNAPSTGDGICHTKESTTTILSPVAVRCKGRPPSKRRLGILEKVSKKKKDKKKKEPPTKELVFDAWGTQESLNLKAKNGEENIDKEPHESLVYISQDFQCQETYDSGCPSMVRKFGQLDMDSQTQGSHEIGYPNMLRGFVPSSVDFQTPDSYDFGHPNALQEFGNLNMVQGFGAMLNQFNMGDASFYDLATRTHDRG